MFPFFCFAVFWRFRDDRRILVSCSGEGRAGGGGKGEEGGEGRRKACRRKGVVPSALVGNTR